MPDCPTCGKTLPTEAGVRQHHAKVHGESLPNRTCSDCGTDFYDPKARREYCEDCDPDAGANNGNYRSAKASAECERCGSPFEYYPSDKEGVYCPDCVAAADEFLGTHYAEVHGIEPVERTCDYCEADFEVLPWVVRRGWGRFCSHDCLSSWMSDHRGDGEAVYNGRWRSARRRTLDRDQHRCQKCGKTSADLGQEPDVHHLEPVRSFDDPQESHVLENLIALCRSCHSRVEWGSISAPSPDAGD